jgi:hypothetical protein
MENKGRLYNPIFLLVILVLFVSLACNLPFLANTPAPTPTPVPDQAIQVVLTTRTPEPPVAGPAAATDTTVPSPTAVPSVTNMPPSATPTNIPIPCNWAQFSMDVTIPDDTEIQANTEFAKTWQLKNVGSCTWNSSYQLIYDHGDKMGSPDSVQFSNADVPPGSTVNLSVKLKAPADAGTYQGYFKLRSPQGVVFGIGGSTKEAFFVRIVSKAAAVVEPIIPLQPVEPLVALAPDLIVTAITLQPNPPVKGQGVTVKVSVYNQGTAASGPYTVAWYPGEAYPNPACTWPVDSSNPKGGRVLTCNYAGYPSPYGSINTKAIVDSAGQVNESNEGNNSLLMNISVKNP